MLFCEMPRPVTSIPSTVQKVEPSDSEALFSKFPPRETELTQYTERMNYHTAAAIRVHLPNLAPNDHKGRRALCVPERAAPFIYDQTNGLSIPLHASTGSKLSQVEFSPDDRLIAFASYTSPDVGGGGAVSSVISMWDATIGKSLWQNSVPGAATDMFFVQPGGKRLVVWRREEQQEIEAWVATFIESETGRIINDLRQDAPSLWSRNTVSPMIL